MNTPEFMERANQRLKEKQYETIKQEYFKSTD